MFTTWILPAKSSFLRGAFGGAGFAINICFIVGLSSSACGLSFRTVILLETTGLLRLAEGGLGTRICVWIEYDIKLNVHVHMYI